MNLTISSPSVFLDLVAFLSRQDSSCLLALNSTPKLVFLMSLRAYFRLSWMYSGHLSPHLVYWPHRALDKTYSLHVALNPFVLKHLDTHVAILSASHIQFLGLIFPLAYLAKHFAVIFNFLLFDRLASILQDTKTFVWPPTWHQNYSTL